MVSIHIIFTKASRNPQKSTNHGMEGEGERKGIGRDEISPDSLKMSLFVRSEIFPHRIWVCAHGVFSVTLIGRTYLTIIGGDKLEGIQGSNRF